VAAAKSEIGHKELWRREPHSACVQESAEANSRKLMPSTASDGFSLYICRRHDLPYKCSGRHAGYGFEKSDWSGNVIRLSALSTEKHSGKTHRDLKSHLASIAQAVFLKPRMSSGYTSQLMSENTRRCISLESPRNASN
jgi:hypothetical protein